MAKAQNILGPPCIRRWSLRSRPCRGFTLEELLVVIAIIVILVAILVPTFVRVRVQMRQVTCQTNLRQLAAAWHFYLQDNQGFFLQGNRTEINYGGKQGRQQARLRKPLNPYLGLAPVIKKAAEPFRCPADSGSRVLRPTCFDYWGTSYRTNTMLIGPTRPPQSPISSLKAGNDLLTQVAERRRNLNRSKVTTDESMLVLMGDYGWLNAFEIASTELIEWHTVPCRHNIVFMDGHAGFAHIRKGLYVTSTYTLVPFANLLSRFSELQHEVPGNCRPGELCPIR